VGRSWKQPADANHCPLSGVDPVATLRIKVRRRRDRECEAFLRRMAMQVSSIEMGSRCATIVQGMTGARRPTNSMVARGPFADSPSRYRLSGSKLV